MGRGQASHTAKAYRRYSSQQIMDTLDLVETTGNVMGVSKSLGINRGTLRYWIEKYGTAEGFAQRRHTPSSFHTVGGHIDDQTFLTRGECLVPEHAERDYSYILGIYLGDGCIDTLARTFRLRIFQDSKYPGLVASSIASLKALLPQNAVSFHKVKSNNSFVIMTHSNSLPLLFPQHAPGKKNARKIELAKWQQVIANRHPEALIAGLIHSDGCRYINRIHGNGKTYEYPTYAFANTSSDILKIFTDACERLGIRWRQDGTRNIVISQRESVAQLEGFILPKS